MSLATPGRFPVPLICEPDAFVFEVEDVPIESYTNDGNTDFEESHYVMAWRYGMRHSRAC